MKSLKYFLLTFFGVLAIGHSFSQEKKKIAGVWFTIEGQNPKTYVFKDELVEITYRGGNSNIIHLEIFNKSNNSIDFLWDETHVVIDGTSYNVENVGISGVKMKAFHTEYIDKTKPQRIAPNSKYKASMKTEKYFFSIFSAEPHYRKNKTTLINRVVPVILIDGVQKDYPLTFEIYSKRHIKDLKSSK